MSTGTRNEAVRAWYSGTVGKDSINAVAARAGIPQASLNRQVGAWSISAENVVAIARAYGVSVLDGLVAQGLITATDILNTRALDALQDATDNQLVDEIARRLERGDDHEALTAPLDGSNVIDGKFGAAFTADEKVFDELNGSRYVAGDDDSQDELYRDDS